MNSLESHCIVRRFLACSVMAGTALAGGGCREPDAPDTRLPEGQLLSVYVVNYPLQYFSETIGGDRIDVSFPAPPNVDPSEWMPDDQTVLAYQQADLIVLNGAGYARWLPRVSLPHAAVVNTAHDFQDRLVDVPDAITHAHGPEGQVHSHAGIAFTTWLDPTLAIEHARAIKQALIARLPEYEEEFVERFASLERDLRALDEEIEKIVNTDRDKPLLVSHPVYQYLEARYGLNIVSLHWEPDELPSDEEWAELDAILTEHPAQWILWEDEPLPETAGRLMERNVASVTYNPCSQPPAVGDFLSVMQENATALARAFAFGQDVGIE